MSETLSEAASPAETARDLMRRCDTASLATALGSQEWPYASLVLSAVDHAGSPILLLSTLAEHTQNLLRRPEACLLFDGTAGLDSRLTGARVSVLGHLERTDDASSRARFLARHPDAAGYADFGDFDFYALRVTRAHLVAGFGRIDWIEADDLLYPVPEDSPLGAQEADVIGHMNEDHADAIALYARELLGASGDDWQMTGVDPEGADLRRGGRVLRLPFDKPIRDAEGARVELVRLVKRARREA